MRCTSFWLQVLNDPIFNGRIPKKVAIECGRKWAHQMRKCLEDFEWRGGLDGSEVCGLSRSEIKDMLKSCMF